MKLWLKWRLVKKYCQNAEIFQDQNWWIQKTAIDKEGRRFSKNEIKHTTVIEYIEWVHHLVKLKNEGTSGPRIVPNLNWAVNV